MAEPLKRSKEVVPRYLWCSWCGQLVRAYSDKSTGGDRVTMHRLNGKASPLLGQMPGTYCPGSLKEGSRTKEGARHA